MRPLSCERSCRLACPALPAWVWGGGAAVAGAGTAAAGTVGWVFAFGLAAGCAGADGGTDMAGAGAVGGTAGTLATFRTLAVLLAGPLWLTVAAYTAAAAMARRATSVIAAAIRPVRKLISSSWALTAARRPA